MRHRKNEKPDVDSLSNRRIRKGDKVILVSIAVLSLFGILFQTEVFDPTYPYPFSTQISDPTLEGRVFDVSVTMRSKTFSAQSPIDVAVAVFIDNENRKQPDNVYQGLPDTLYFLFVGSTKYPVTPTGISETVEGGWVTLTKHPDNTYHGTERIVYGAEGDYPTMLSNILPKVVHTPKDAGSPQVHISSVEGTIGLHTNNLFVTLTFIFMIITIITARDQINNIIN